MYLTKSYPASGFNRLSRALSSLSIVSLELMKGPTSESPTPTSSIVYLGQCLTPSLTLNKRLSLLALILTGRGAVVLIRQTMARMGYCSSCFGSGRGGKLQNGIIAEGGIFTWSRKWKMRTVASSVHSITSIASGMHRIGRCSAVTVQPKDQPARLSVCMSLFVWLPSSDCIILCMFGRMHTCLATFLCACVCLCDCKSVCLANANVPQASAPEGLVGLYVWSIARLISQRTLSAASSDVARLHRSDDSLERSQL